MMTVLLVIMTVMMMTDANEVTLSAYNVSTQKSSQQLQSMEYKGKQF